MASPPANSNTDRTDPPQKYAFPYMPQIYVGSSRPNAKQDRKKQAFTDKLGHQHFFCPWEHTGLVTNLQMTVASYRNSKISLKNQFSSRHSSTGEGEAGSKTLKEKKKKTVP